MSSHSRVALAVLTGVVVGFGAERTPDPDSARMRSRLSDVRALAKEEVALVRARRHAQDKATEVGIQTRAESIRLRLLGPMRAVSADEASHRAYEKLMSPTEFVEFGHSCGKGGGPVGGHVAQSELSARPDLLRNILRGPNPVGRVLAAEALLEKGEATFSDRVAIATIAAVTPAITGCEGCYGMVEIRVDDVIREAKKIAAHRAVAAR